MDRTNPLVELLRRRNVDNARLADEGLELAAKIASMEQELAQTRAELAELTSLRNENRHLKERLATTSAAREPRRGHEGAGPSSDQPQLASPSRKRPAATTPEALQMLQRAEAAAEGPGGAAGARSDPPPLALEPSGVPGFLYLKTPVPSEACVPLVAGGIRGLLMLHTNTVLYNGQEWEPNKFAREGITQKMPSGGWQAACRVQLDGGELMTVNDYELARNCGLVRGIKRVAVGGRGSRGQSAGAEGGRLTQAEAQAPTQRGMTQTQRTAGGLGNGEGAAAAAAAAAAVVPTPPSGPPPSKKQPAKQHRKKADVPPSRGGAAAAAAAADQTAGPSAAAAAAAACRVGCCGSPGTTRVPGDTNKATCAICWNDLMAGAGSGAAPAAAAADAGPSGRAGRGRRASQARAQVPRPLPPGVSRLTCGHEFHQGCISTWLGRCSTCPTCRAGVEEFEGSRLPQRNVLMEAARAIDDAICMHCRVDENDSLLLLCDGCDAGFHVYCLNPPLDAIPPGEWFCPGCVAANEAVHRDALTQRGRTGGAAEAEEAGAGAAGRYGSPAAAAGPGAAAAAVRSPAQRGGRAAPEPAADQLNSQFGASSASGSGTSSSDSDSEASQGSEPEAPEGRGARAERTAQSPRREGADDEERPRGSPSAHNYSSGSESSGESGDLSDSDSESSGSGSSASDSDSDSG